MRRLRNQSADLGQLGTPDADAVEITKRTLFSAEDLEVKAEAAMKRRQETGVADRVERMQPKQAPEFDQVLVGKRLEILWKYFDKDTNAPRMIWSTGTVKRVADGLTDKRSKKAKSVLPAGLAQRTSNLAPTHPPSPVRPSPTRPDPPQPNPTRSSLP